MPNNFENMHNGFYHVENYNSDDDNYKDEEIRIVKIVYMLQSFLRMFRR